MRENEASRDPLGSSIWFRVNRFFSSLVLGLVLLILLAIASLAGIVIAQNAPPAAYIRQFGETGYNVLHALWLTDVYHSWWFLLLLLLLALNLLFCSLSRLKGTYRTAHRSSFLETPEELQSCRVRREVRSGGTAEATVRQWLEALQRRRYRARTVEREGRHRIFAQKGAVSRWGCYVTHLGIILVLLGGIGTARMGFRFDRDCGVGETFDVPESTFRVRVDDFTIETTPEGQVKDYKSVLTVLDPDSVLTKTIEVNHPLVYKGIDFYQSSYGQESGRVRAALLQIQGGGPEPVEQSLEVLWGTRQPVPGTNLAVEIRGFVPDFVMDLNTGEVTTRSREARNPAVRIAVYEGEHLLYDEWVFAASRGMHPSMGRPYNFRLLDFAPQLYTGLQISHNPALPLVYIGFLAMSFGLFLSFYLSHRRLWVLIWQEKGKTRSLVGGNANKGTLGLEREIEKMAREMEK